MPITTPKEMFDRAYKEGYAIGAFNVNNMEIIQGIMQAGAEERSPLILQGFRRCRKYAGQVYIMKLGGSRSHRSRHSGGGASRPRSRL